MVEQSEEDSSQYYLDVEHRIVVLQLRGRITLETMMVVAERLYADERYEPEFSAIADIQTMDWALDFSEMHEYSKYVNDHPRKLRGKLIIVASTAVAYGIGRMYQGTNESLPGEVHFETTMGAALKALGAT